MYFNMQIGKHRILGRTCNTYIPSMRLVTFRNAQVFNTNRPHGLFKDKTKILYNNDGIATLQVLSWRRCCACVSNIHNEISFKLVLDVCEQLSVCSTFYLIQIKLTNCITVSRQCKLLINFSSFFKGSQFRSLLLALL